MSGVKMKPVNDRDIVYDQIQIRQDDINQEERTVSLSFSSEVPAKRWYGYETLDHSPESVDLTRLNNGGAFLLNHDSDKHIGVIQSARIENRKGKAVVRFGDSEFAKEIFSDVVNGIRSLVSVGYRIYEYILEKKIDEEEYYRVTRWEPLEVSLVSIPVDTSVGVGRQVEGKNNHRRENNMNTEPIPGATPGTDPQAIPGATPETDPGQDENMVRVSLANERERAAEILAVSQKFKLPDDYTKKALSEGVSIEQFKAGALSHVAKGAKTPIDSSSTDGGGLDMSNGDVGRYSLSRLMKAIVENRPQDAGFEVDVSQEITRKLGRAPTGIYVPHEVLIGKSYTEMAKRDLLASGGASSLVSTDALPDSFIGMLRNRIVVNQLNPTVLTGLMGSIDIPKQTGAATSAWIATEGTAVTASDQTFTNVSLSAKTVAADTIIGRQAIIQANPSIEMLVMNDLIEVLARAIDLGALNGSGAAGQPTGILNTAGIGAVAGASLAWAGVVEFETDVLAANAGANDLYYVMSAAVQGLLKTRTKDAGSGMFLIEDGRMNGYDVIMSNQMPASTILFGDFSDLILAYWGVLDLLIDPYSLSANRNIRVSSTQYCDVGVRHAGSFSASSTVT